LGDATRFLSGYFLQPAITAFEDDITWGQVGGVRFPVINGNFLVRKGRVCKDEVLCRNENSYWQWTVYDFNTWTLFFTNRGVGEWFVEQRDQGSVGVRYVYRYNSINPIFHLLIGYFQRFK
jgi:hypothetical protein